jgi:hypothetical protein
MNTSFPSIPIIVVSFSFRIMMWGTQILFLRSSSPTDLSSSATIPRTSVECPVQVLHQHVRFELQLIRRFNMSQVYLHVNRQSFGTRRFGQLVVATAVCQLRDELLLREGVHVRLQKGTRVVRRGRLSRRGLGHVVGVRQNRSGFGGGSTGQGLRLLQGFRRWRD